MDRKLWHRWRKDGIGGSDAPVLMGVSPYKTPYELYLEKISIEDVQEESNVATDHGKENEIQVRDWLELEGETLLKEDWVIMTGKPHLRASLDAISLDGKMLYEIKCPYRNEKHHLLAKEGKIPEVYHPQLQHQMMVTGLPYMTYVSFFKNDYVLVPVYRDEEYIENLMKVEDNFWFNHVLPRIAPKKTERDYLQMDGEDWELVAQEWMKVKDSLSSLEKTEDNLRRRLIGLSEGRNAIGKGLRLTQSVEDGRTDYKRAYYDLLEISALPEQNLDSYKGNPITKYRLSVY